MTSSNNLIEFLTELRLLANFVARATNPVTGAPLTMPDNAGATPRPAPAPSSSR